MKRLSIIIPAYNVAQYIVRCIESCETQLSKTNELEIIVIDDGSTDNTSEVVETLISTYSNIIYERQENAGQAAARNRGVDIATGQYVWFVDGDDYLASEGIEPLLNNAFLHELDIQAFNIQLVDEVGVVTQYRIHYEKNGKIYSGREFVLNVSMPHSPCLALIKREFLASCNIRFLEGTYFEDFEYTVRLYSMAQKCSYIDEVHYNYLQRSGSTMKYSDKQKNAKRSKDLLKVADSLFQFGKSNFVDGSKERLWLLNNVGFAVTQSLFYYSPEAYDLYFLKSKPYIPLDLTSARSKNEKLKFWLINNSLPLYRLLLKLKRYQL